MPLKAQPVYLMVYTHDFKSSTSVFNGTHTYAPDVYCKHGSERSNVFTQYKSWTVFVFFIYFFY
uniref:Uncharacterized protein n=1 Tax=Anguilla anguilla TaxID=7936 RepID=A0A0E9XQE3_ANGAN